VFVPDCRKLKCPDQLVKHEKGKQLAGCVISEMFLVGKCVENVQAFLPGGKVSKALAYQQVTKVSLVGVIHA